MGITCDLRLKFHLKDIMRGENNCQRKNSILKVTIILIFSFPPSVCIIIFEI